MSGWALNFYVGISYRLFRQIFYWVLLCALHILVINESNIIDQTLSRPSVSFVCHVFLIHHTTSVFPSTLSTCHAKPTPKHTMLPDGEDDKEDDDNDDDRMIIMTISRDDNDHIDVDDN